MQRKACDQCYALKKKCVIPSTSTSCLRCTKASLICTTSRHQPRAGRPPKPDRGLPRTAKASLGIWNYSIPSERNTDFSILDDDGDNFYLHHDIYMLGSTFAPDFHRSLVYCRQHSSHLLDDIFLACSSSLSWARFGILPATEVDVRSGAASVQKLRSATITNAHDAVAVLMLGQALSAFDTLVDCTATMSILRYSLELVRPWYAEILTLGSGVLEPVAVVPVFWDTIWCLLNGETPIIERGSVFRLRKGVVDRVVGVCTGLMPMMYDLCVVSRELAGLSTTGETKLEDQKCALETIAHRVRSWDPERTSELSNFTPFEILSMKTQASMYRTGILLLIHHLHLRLHLRHHHNYPRNQDGDGDWQTQTAQILASTILTTRANFFSLAGPTAKLQNTSFPLLLALLEIAVSTDGMWESSTWLRHKPACVKRLFGFVEGFWRWKEEGNGCEIQGDVFDFTKDRNKSGRGMVPLI
ncbi:Zn(II)2Cys6 transcription factor domain-containing protein [Aspergillus undulatus]|uniref:Zn(II)2Cys6 transcription factor domain-containing protein n=1 Tax=Aspergillus undulatus TaxID=1810928 RepID=UPI003CCD35A6